MGQNSYQCMKTNYTQIKLIFIPVYKGADVTWKVKVTYWRLEAT